jgi:hypothetical protein
MTGPFLVQPQMSYREFKELLNDIQIRGIRAIFKRPVIVGDEAGPPNCDLGDPKLIAFVGAPKELLINNLRIEWDSLEDNVILSRWKEL